MKYIVLLIQILDGKPIKIKIYIKKILDDMILLNSHEPNFYLKKKQKKNMRSALLFQNKKSHCLWCASCSFLKYRIISIN